jgi:hypothetical protein
MAHYAILDKNNYVTDVIVGRDEDEIVLDDNGNPIDWEVYYGGKRTSYWTYAGQHKNGGIPFRKNYAGIGFKYDEVRDAFIPPRPYESWTLNEETCRWQSPKPFEEVVGTWVWIEDARRWYNKLEDTFL